MKQIIVITLVIVCCVVFLLADTIFPKKKSIIQQPNQYVPSEHVLEDNNPPWQYTQEK